MTRKQRLEVVSKKIRELRHQLRNSKKKERAVLKKQYLESLAGYEDVFAIKEAPVGIQKQAAQKRGVFENRRLTNKRINRMRHFR